MPTTTISTLESHLWEAANILRGSPVDRTDWKSYILPLMFFKHVMDNRAADTGHHLRKWSWRAGRLEDWKTFYGSRL